MCYYVYADHAQYTIKTYAKMALFPLVLSGPFSVHCQMAVAPLPNDAPAMRDLDALREVRAGGELIGRHRRGRLLGPRRPARR